MNTNPQATTKESEFIYLDCPVGGQQIRGIMLENCPYFVGKDICVALGYKNPSKALSDHCKGVTKHHPFCTPGGVQQIRIISEPDMYRLIINSKLPEAQRFDSWVFEEVLPVLRSSGGYLVTIKEESPEELIGRALKVAEATLARSQTRTQQRNENESPVSSSALIQSHSNNE